MLQTKQQLCLYTILYLYPNYPIVFIMFFLFKEENKRIELLWPIAIEFTVPPVKPTNGIFLICLKLCSKAKF